MILKRVYQNQKDCHNAIDKGFFNAASCNKRDEMIKDNISKITHINGEPCEVLGMIGGNTLEVVYPWSRLVQWVTTTYVDINFSEG